MLYEYRSDKAQINKLKENQIYISPFTRQIQEARYLTVYEKSTRVLRSTISRRLGDKNKKRGISREAAERTDDLSVTVTPTRRTQESADCNKTAMEVSKVKGTVTEPC